MAGSFFSGFNNFSRPDIGLVSDSSRNLSEIYESDKREALRNILLFPEVLDSIYKVSESITTEDLRSTSGLSRLLLPSLDQIDEIAADRIPNQLYIDKDYFTPTFPFGGTGAAGINTPNVILFNGSLKCYGAEYLANTIDQSLFENPKVSKVALSTSRASLLNAEADPDAVGYIKTARYTGAIRVRRRSHVNRIFLPKTSFITKSNARENPTHSILVKTNNNGTESDVRLLATKNTPLRVYCRLTKGSIKFKFTDAQRPYFFGFQIQPAQQRPNSDPVDFLPVESLPQPAGLDGEGSLEYSVEIDISETGYQNLYDLYLYIYVNPEKVEGIEMSGIDVREFPNQQDLGLIGFNNLRDFKVSGGSMTILPIWLKTLDGKLRTLDLSGTGDTWRSGPMGWFDRRNPSATASPSYPPYTVVSYLTLPQSGPLINSEGDDWNGSTEAEPGLAEKYILDLSRTPGTDYRPYSSLTTLRLGGRFYGENPRFDDVFPNLTELSWGRNNNMQLIFGKPPKVKKNNLFLSYDVSGTGVSGSITDIGTSDTLADADHISKYSFGSFLVNGTRDRQHNSLTGYINNPSDAGWTSWKTNTGSINIEYTDIQINLQSGPWNNLQSLSAAYSGGVQFTTPSGDLQTPRLTSLSLYGSGTTGQMPKIGRATNLESISIGACNSIDAVDTYYLLPSDFTVSGVEYKLKSFSAAYFTPSYRLREGDFVNFKYLESLSFERSGLTGVFPTFPSEKDVEKPVNISISFANFYDLRKLNINSTNVFFSRDVRSLSLGNQNISGGGCILPEFIGTSSSNLQRVEMSGSLPTLVPSADTELSGLSLINLADNIYYLSGYDKFKSVVRVNDTVRSGTTPVAKVLSVLDDRAYVELLVPPSGITSTLSFTRNTVDISNWFEIGFSSLLSFRARNCRLSGHLNIRSGFDSIINGSSGEPALDLSTNLISQVSGLNLIFRARSRAVTVDLSRNNLSPSSIRDIITQISSIDLVNYRNSRIIVSANKFNASTNSYNNYEIGEIFPVTISPGADIRTQVLRDESFNVYEEKVNYTESGAEIKSYPLVASTVIRVPGELFSGKYYTIKVEKPQESSEHPVAALFKNLKNIKVDLGVPYTSPNTNPVIVSSSYDPASEVTREQSITSTGLEKLASCPSPLTGSCWRNSSGQILKLN